MSGRGECGVRKTTYFADHDTRGSDANRSSNCEYESFFGRDIKVRFRRGMRKQKDRERERERARIPTRLSCENTGEGVSRVITNISRIVPPVNTR